MEKNVQDSRRRVWIDAAQQRFGTFVELNAWLAARCQALWEEIRHPEHEQFSVAEMLENERSHLMTIPEPFDGYVEKSSRVSSTCLVPPPAKTCQSKPLYCKSALGRLSLRHWLRAPPRLVAIPALEFKNHHAPRQAPYQARARPDGGHVDTPGRQYPSLGARSGVTTRCWRPHE